MDSLRFWIRFLAERGWRVGFLVTFCGAAVLAGHRIGFPLEFALASWIPYASLAVNIGLGIILCSWSVNIIESFEIGIRNRARRKAKLFEETEHQRVLNMLQTLSQEEREALSELLMSSKIRFEISIGSPGSRLVAKKILLLVSTVGRAMLAEFHPAILNNKEVIQRQISDENDQIIHDPIIAAKT